MLLNLTKNDLYQAARLAREQGLESIGPFHA